MTITIDETVYNALQAIIKRRSIGGFLTEVVQNREFARMSQQVYTEAELEAGYRAMAADEEYERDAREWIAAVMETLFDLGYPAGIGYYLSHELPERFFCGFPAPLTGRCFVDGLFGERGCGGGERRGKT